MTYLLNFAPFLYLANVIANDKTSGMLILVLVLKDSLRTFYKSLSLSWFLGVRSLSLSWSVGVRSLSLSLSWSLWVSSLSLSWSLWSSPCPCPCFSPCKDLFPLFQYSVILIYSHIIVVSMHTIG